MQMKAKLAVKIDDAAKPQTAEHPLLWFKREPEDMEELEMRFEMGSNSIEVRTQN